MKRRVGKLTLHGLDDPAGGMVDAAKHDPSLRAYTPTEGPFQGQEISLGRVLDRLWVVYGPKRQTTLGMLQRRSSGASAFKNPDRDVLGHYEIDMSSGVAVPRWVPWVAVPREGQ